MKKYDLLGISFLIMLLGIGLTICSPSAHAQSGFNYTDHLMDDAVFRASNTMSAADIQAFLVGKGSGLTTFSDVETCGTDSRGAMMAAYSPSFSCGTTQLASKIIYDAAQAYGINPQVLLATMQKEQSLVTTPNPITSQLNYAMGYGCPDSGSCYLTGFFNQVAWAAWQFRYDFESSSGNSYGGWAAGVVCNGATKYYSAALKPGNNVTFYNDYGTGYANFIIPNASTAALYCYTPHVYPGSSQEYYSGSYWFVYYFNLWFPTLASAPGGGVYKIEINGTTETKRAFPSEIIFLSYGYKFTDVFTISSAAMNLITPGADMPYNVDYRDGHLVSSPSNGIYVVSNGAKLPFPNEATFLSYGYTWSDALVISNAELNLIPDGAAMPFNAHHWDGHLVTSSSNGIYDIENGLKRPFPNEITFLSYFYKWTDPSVISSSELSQIPVGAAMPFNAHHWDGHLVTSSSNGIYDIENGLKRPFPNEATFFSYSFTFSDALVISNAELNLIPDGVVMPMKT